MKSNHLPFPKVGEHHHCNQSCWNLEWTVGIERLEWTVENHLYLVLGSSHFGELPRGAPSRPSWTIAWGVAGWGGWGFLGISGKAGHFRKIQHFPKGSMILVMSSTWKMLLTFSPRDGEEHVCQRQRNTFTGDGPKLSNTYVFLSIWWDEPSICQLLVWTAEYQVEGTHTQAQVVNLSRNGVFSPKYQCFNGECDTQ